MYVIIKMLIVRLYILNSNLPTCDRITSHAITMSQPNWHHDQLVFLKFRTEIDTNKIQSFV